MISEGFIRYATINKRRYSFIKKLMVFDKTYESFVRASYNGRHGLRGLNNSHDQLKIIFYKEITTRTYEIFKRTQQRFHSSASVQLSQRDLCERSVKQCEILEETNKKELQELRPSNRSECSSTVGSHSEISSPINEERDNSASTPLDQQYRVLIERSGFLEEVLSGGKSIEGVIADLEQSISRTDESIKRNKRKAAAYNRESRQAADGAAAYNRESRQAADGAAAIDRKLAIMREEANRKQISDSLARYASEVEMQFDMFTHCRGNMQRWINAGATLENIATLSEYVSTILPEVRTKRERWVFATISKWYIENKHNMRQALAIQPFVPFG